MIKSIKFPKKGSGYIYEKPEDPGKEPDRNDYRYWEWDFKHGNSERVFKKEKYNADYERWAEGKKFYDENKGQFINPAAKHLIGKTFEFEPGKLNIIFGPNGCGKTTILKAIAGNAGIAGDGMTHPADPTDIFSWDAAEKYDVKKVAKYINKLKQNTAEVKWDGNVVYYDNFAHTMRHGLSFFGGLEGTALGSFKDEIAFRMNGERVNSGKKAMWLFNNVLNYQKGGITLEKIFAPKLNNGRMNDLWSKSYKVQAEYFQQYENYGKEVPMTILFDEPEVNFDIPTVWSLYSVAFPKICEDYGTQFITVSHSPLVMSQEILDNEWIKVISIDDDYTARVKEFLKTMKF